MNSVTVESVPAPMPEMDYAADVDMQVRTAKTYPRNVQQFLLESRAAVTLNEDVAGSCMYALPRGGKTIPGPSIRLAEIAASAWGNLRIQTRVVEGLADADRFVTGEGAIIDLEKNLGLCMQKKRRCTDRSGKPYNDDMRTVTINAATSIAFRDAVIKVIPRVYIEDLYAAARQVVVGDATTIETRRAKALKHFNDMGIPTERVLARMERGAVEQLTADDLAALVGVATRLREGAGTVEEEFPPIDDGSKGNDAVREKLKKK